MITKEIWLPLNTNIDRFSSLRKDYYMISNYGRIGKTNGNILTINNTTRPPSVSLMKTGSYATQRIGVNILVALHFMYRPDHESHFIINLDGNQMHNHVNNLMWDDHLAQNNLKLMCSNAMKPLPIESYPGEVWTHLPHVEELSACDISGIYVSTFGRVYNAYTENIMGCDVTGGYSATSLPSAINRKERIKCPIHRLVMLAFSYIPGCEKLQVNHIDGNKHNNYITNLEWVTCQGNIQHAYCNGLSYQIGDTHTESIYSNGLVGKIVQMIVDGIPSEDIMRAVPEINKIGFIMDIRACRTRVGSIAQYLVGIDKTPRTVFGEAKTKELISMCINYPSSTVFREAIGYSNPASYEYFVSGVLYYIVTHGVTWIPFIQL